MRRAPIVAIDGPAGAGKSTASRMLAERLGFVLVDTGALYRGVALAAREAGVRWDDADALGEMARTLDIRFSSPVRGVPRLLIDGVDRSGDIRTPEISRAASDVSRFGAVREALLGLQRRLGSPGGAVLEGRDIGTVVFPDAEVKVFLTASTEVRARRRVADLAARGTVADYHRTLDEIRLRDAQDAGREAAPLRTADDAVTLDTTALSLDQVVDRLVEIVAARAPGSTRGPS